MLSTAYQDWLQEILSTSNTRKYDYVIVCGKNGQQYYFKDIDDRTTAIQLIWTPAQRNAYLFKTEQDVEEFKSNYVSPRKASIIRLPKTALSILEMLS